MVAKKIGIPPRLGVFVTCIFRSSEGSSNRDFLYDITITLRVEYQTRKNVISNIDAEMISIVNCLNEVQIKIGFGWRLYFFKHYDYIN
jgi:putative component of toxin-antitoxin plasmid stabilization module